MPSVNISLSIVASQRSNWLCRAQMVKRQARMAILGIGGIVLIAIGVVIVTLACVHFTP